MPQRTIVAALSACLFLCFLPSSADAARHVRLDRRPLPTVIEGVDVFESESGTTSGPHDVWLDGEGRIEAVTEAGERPVPEDVSRVSGEGRTLLPGLVDSHVHLVGDGDPGIHLGPSDIDRNLTGLLWGGVTTVLSTGDALDAIERLSEATRTGRKTGPAIYYVGRPVTAVGGHPVASALLVAPKFLHRLIDRVMATQVGTVAEAEQAVMERSQRGAAAVKVVFDDLPQDTPQMSVELLGTIVSVAHRVGIRVIAHVGEPEDVPAALDVGVDGFVHHPNRGALDEQTVARLVADQVPVVATLFIFERLAGLSDEAPQISSMERLLAHPRPLRRLDRGGYTEGAPEPLAVWMRTSREAHDSMRASVAALDAAGGVVVAGSDTSNVGGFIVAGLHGELDSLVGAGLSPTSALQAATWRAARFVDPRGEFGAVRAGWEADLVLVEGDPTTDIDTVHRPLEVWADGRRVHRLTPLDGLQ